MNINLGSETESRLLLLAAATGASVEDFLRTVVEEKSALTTPRRLTSAEWAVQFEEWADSVPDAPLIPDEALRRE